MVAGDTQAVTFSANDATGAAHAVTVNLADAANGVSLTQALTAINGALQNTNDSTLQKITAVQNSAGTGINFISTLTGFTATVAASSSGTTGVNSGVAPAAPVQALQVGAGSTANISTLAGANAAVSAVSAAVAALGTAQAAIGKGENQLNYALNLASSQITNFSAAESQIRDADVAQQAANLTKAQVLQQASIAAMAQANSAPQAVLSLLKA
jgi:flagellin